MVCKTTCRTELGMAARMLASTVRLSASYMHRACRWTYLVGIHAFEHERDIVECE
jgi:hypothetical protein